MNTVSRSRSTDQRYYGIAEAIVTEVRNDGHVKVTYPWFNEDMVSEWARVAQFFAGPDHGAFFIPEVGSEVVVAFIHGDMRFPVILGGFFNGKDLPPGTDTELDTHVRHRRIQTPSGQRLSFFDPESASATGGIEIENSNGDAITMSTNGTMRLKCSGAFIVEAAVVSLNGRILTPNANPL
ncbi:phage baseplate assembly protein V [Sedimenticola selenatireducens]|uniref:Type IV secretion protein Rhs n=1 Tax=Sedimenticola selenatireducens TaxID=191960 RepID=A0A2N6CT26_9GAMM|nr:phage baseplate assembly protein V [Sedimenticola selenatireducens]PLX60267.1 MAG: type IV secretion protein Rhs [Sedimenticola selenatireducens]